MRISVVIPAYNEEKLIGETLESLKKQDLDESLWEIVVVDNNSSDKTSEVAKKHGARVIVFKDAQGVSPAREAGVKAAAGEIIAFTDADTTPGNDWLSKIDEVMKDEKVVVVGGKILPYGSGGFTRFLFSLYDVVVSIHTKLGKPMLWGNNFAARKSVIEGVGGFNVKLSTSEDWDLCGRIQRKYGKAGYRIVYLSSMVNETSNRKQQNLGVFLRYMWQGTVSYFNVVLLGKAKSGKIVSIR